MDYDARFYDPYLNRWIQPYTIIPDQNNSQDWNRYSYVNNNPINHNDPSGHCFSGAVVDTIVCVATVGGIAGAIGGTLGYVIPTLIAGERINGKSLAIAAGAGAITGALAPVIAIAAPEAAIPLTGALFALVSGSQYAVDQKVNNKPVDTEQVVVHAAIGGALGLLTAECTNLD